MATQNTHLSICQDRRKRGKAGALQAIVDVSGMVSFSKKRRNGAQPVLQKSFKGVWGDFPNKHKVAPSHLAKVKEYKRIFE